MSTLLLSPPAPGWLHMATDQAMLDLAEAEGCAVLRLYRWEPSCLSFGRNEAVLRHYDRVAIEALGVDVVRRPTGGRAVWHADELTYAVAAPLARYGSLARAYREIHAMLAAALCRLGVDATLAPTRAQGGNGHSACFADPVGGEVIAGGKKLVGSAQLRQGNAFLQHGSILLSGTQDLVARVSRGAVRPRGEITLCDILGRAVPADELAGAIESEIPSGVSLVSGLEGAVDRHGEQFRSSDWIWRR